MEKTELFDHCNSVFKRHGDTSVLATQYSDPQLVASSWACLSQLKAQSLLQPLPIVAIAIIENGAIMLSVNPLENAVINVSEPQ